MRAFAFLAVILLFTAVVPFALAQTVSHEAEQVKPGMFGAYFAAGNYTFNNSLSITDKLGIGTAGPASKLQVQGGAVLFNGTIGSTPTSGEGTRLMWIPAKAAFRAGYVSGAQWDDASIGLYSFAAGDNTVASGGYSTALGYATTASAFKSTAMGDTTTASQESSTAMGRSTTASGFASTAMGFFTTASGDYTTAIGKWVTAAGAGASNIITLGAGVDNGNRLVNNIANSLMVGFGSTTPTLFVNGSSVGIGTTSPQNKLDVEGGAVIGATYSGTNAAPSNGLLVEGNVGIGTTDPDTALHIVGGGMFKMGPTGSIDAGSIILQPLSTFFRIQSEELRFWDWSYGNDMVTFKNGNVGIGTTSPSQKLDVNGSTVIRGDLNVTGTSYLGNVEISAELIKANTIQSKTGNILFKNTTGTEAMRIAEAGNVGIGTTETAAAKLTLSSNAYTGGLLRIYPNRAASSQYFLKLSSSQPIANHVDYYLSAYDVAGGGENMMLYLDSSYGTVGINRISTGDYVGANTPMPGGMIVSGNVGIGTASPSEKLDVNGSARIAVPVGPWSSVEDRYNVEARDANPQDIFWDGTYWWLLGRGTNAVWQYTSNWVLTGVNYSVAAQDSGGAGIFWDGTNWWLLGITNDRVYKYNSTWGYTGVNYSVLGQEPSGSDIFWDGTNWWMVGWGTNSVYKYNSTWGYTGVNYSVAASQDIFWDGANWWVSGGNIVFQYNSTWGYTGVNYTVDGGSTYSIYRESSNWWGLQSGANDYVYKYRSSPYTVSYVNTSNYNVGIGTERPTAVFTVAPPATQIVNAGNIITADGCGTVKRVFAEEAVTTSTTNTFTAPTITQAGCCMTVHNIAPVFTVTLDFNANFKTAGGVDIALGSYDSVVVCSTGTYWFQATALLAAS